MWWSNPKIKSLTLLIPNILFLYIQRWKPSIAPLMVPDIANRNIEQSNLCSTTSGWRLLQYVFAPELPGLTESSADVMDEFKKHLRRPWKLELLKWFHRAMISLSAVDNGVNSRLLRSPHNYFVMCHISAVLPLQTHFNTASAIMTVSCFFYFF